MDAHERLELFTQKYGIPLQDLYLLNPHLKLIVEFLVLELDSLNNKVDALTENNLFDYFGETDGTD